jgi:hypothetical protein
MNAKEIMIEVDKLYSGPEKWIQRRFQKDNSFCFVGALGHITDMNRAEILQYFTAMKSITKAIRENTNFRNIVEFNDNIETTFEDIKKILKIAIETT